MLGRGNSAVQGCTLMNLGERQAAMRSRLARKGEPKPEKIDRRHLRHNRGGKGRPAKPLPEIICKLISKGGAKWQG